MGWFGRKSDHEKQVRAFVTVMGNFFEKTLEGGVGAPLVLKLALPDSKLRYAMFSLGTTQVACACHLNKPDAILNDVLQTMVAGAVQPGTPFSLPGRSDPQDVANRAGSYLADYLHRWSSYVDIATGSNAGAATSIVCGMLRHAESDAPPDSTDAKRLWPLATWIEGQLPIMRGAFKGLI